MKVMVVENSKKAMSRLSEIIREQEPASTVLAIGSSPEALAAAREQEIDVVFLDVALPEIHGLVLGRYLRDLNPAVNLIYMTKSRADAFDAIGLRASGCLLLPVEEEDVRTELKELRNPPGKKERKRVFAQTFGNFELFIDGEPVAFKYTRTKEMVALLVNNRGAQTTNGEIIATLWEDDGDPRVKISYLSNLRQDLQNTLTKHNVSDMILKQRGSIAIAVDHIECDLYDWLEKKKESRYQYLGDYMTQYGWAEFMHAEIDNISYALEDE